MSRRLKVLYYMEPGSPFHGVANVAYYLSRALSKEVDVIYFPKFRFERRYFSSLLEIFVRFLRKEFDVIHFNVVPAFINGGFLLLILAKKLGIKTCLNIHGIIELEQDLEPKNPILYELGLLKTIIACKIADVIVVNSRWMLNEVTTRYKVPPNKIIVIPNGINIEEFSLYNGSLKLDGEPAIVFVGRVNKIKGIDILIKAVSLLKPRLPNLKLYIIGKGKLREFQQLVYNEGLEKNIIFLGPKPRGVLIKYLKSADICVVPSIYESFGIVVLEALAADKPVIASKTGGIPDIIKDGENGILVHPGDPEDLAEAILKLSKDTQLRAKLSQNARKTITKYDWHNIAKRYVQLYRKIIMK